MRRPLSGVKSPKTPSQMKCLSCIMPELILALLYVCAVGTGTLYVASGLYGTAPIWLTQICDPGGLLCEAPYLAPVGSLALGYLYRFEEAREKTSGYLPAQWRIKLRRWLA